jgi:outer membrane protein TolC
MKKILIFCLITFLPALTAAQKASLSVDDAISYALKNNPGIIAASHSAKSASHGATAAKGNYLPRVDLLAAGAKINDPLYIDLNDVRAAVIGASVIAGGDAGVLESSIPSFEKKFLDDTFVRVMATVTQPIFTGFKVSANAAVKKLEKIIAEINLQNARNSAITSAVEDYYRAKLALAVIEIHHDLEENIKKHVSNAKQLFNNGMISKANLLKAEVALADAKKDYQKALMDKELAFILLTNTIGVNAEQFELTSHMEMIVGLSDVDFYVSKAQSNNNSIKLLNAKKLMLKQKYKAAVGDMLPNIAAVGGYQILQDKLTAVEPEWALALTASLNVFRGGAGINEIKAAKAELKALDAEIENVNSLIFTAVKKLYHACQAALKDCEALKTSQTLAAENLKLYRISFREGMATSLEVVDAELALAEIKTEMSKAVFDYNCAYANLLNICAISEENFQKYMEPSNEKN